MYAIPTGITLIKFRTTLIRGTGRSKDMGSLQGRRKMKSEKNEVQIKLGGNNSPRPQSPYLLAPLLMQCQGNTAFARPQLSVFTSIINLTYYTLFNKIKNMTTDFTSNFTECV